MGLDEAVRIGRFCGLTTVEECVRNISMHATQLFKYTEIGKELEQLHEDYDLYLDGHYKLDIENIDLKNKEEMDKWITEEEYNRLHPDDICEELDFDFKD